MPCVLLDVLSLHPVSYVELNRYWANMHQTVDTQ